MKLVICWGHADDGGAAEVGPERVHSGARGVPAGVPLCCGRVAGVGRRAGAAGACRAHRAALRPRRLETRLVYNGLTFYKLCHFFRYEKKNLLSFPWT